MVTGALLRRPLSVVGHPQQMNAEQTIAPDRERRPAAAVSQRLEGIDRIFVTVLGVDRLAGAELAGDAAHSDLLPPGAGEVHLDAPALGVVEGVVLEGGEIEIGTELAIDASEQIQV